MTHIINLSEILDLTPDQLITRILETSSLRLAELKVLDLVMPDGTLLRTGNGVYVLHLGKLAQIAYVGKATSRSFIERLPAHFDGREKAWFNTMLKRTLARRGGTVEQALAHLSNNYVTLINFENENDLVHAGKLESLLRVKLTPDLNPPKSKEKKDLQDFQKQIRTLF